MGVDVGPIGDRAAQPCAQVGDGYVYDPGQIVLATAPDGREEVGAGAHAAGRTGQLSKQGELAQR